ncbi:MAG: TRAP transporter substrate-binding protein [Rhodospirillaceae bacterium]
MNLLRFGGALAGLAAAFAILPLADAPAVAETYVMKIGTATPRGDQNTWMDRFKERVEKRAGDRISIRLFPSSQLGAIPRQIEGMQLGTVEGWVGPPGFVKSVDPRYQVVDAPGIFRDKAHAQKTLTDPDFRDYFLELGKARGVFGISIYVPTVVSIVSKSKPILTLDDFKGQKIRVLASDLEVEAMRRLGAAPTPMPLLEVLPSLQHGALDGVRSGMVIFVPFKYWTVARDLTETSEGMVPVAAFISSSWWNKLPQSLQEIMLEEAKKLDDEIYQWALDYNDGLRRTWLENGGRIHKLSDADRAEMMTRLASVGADVVADKPEIKAVFDRMVETAGKH